MAQQEYRLGTENISCSICLDLLKEPATLNCGHNYCMRCIQNYWDSKAGERGAFSCPQCMKIFGRRPKLQKNNMLADLVEALKKTNLQANPADHCYAGAEDVACDVCTGRKLKAAKSCLFCSASYCQEHLLPHYQAAPLKKHELVEPHEKLQENLCPRHDVVMKMFCCTDQQCICYLCDVGEHQGHVTVSVAAERVEKQRELETTQGQIQQRIQDRQKHMKLLDQEVGALNGSADGAVKHSKKVFIELIQQMHRRSFDVEQQIRFQQETEVRRVKDLQKKLEREITKLKEEDADLQKLAHTQDHTHFLNRYTSLPTHSRPTHSSCTTERPLRYFHDITVVISEVRGQIENMLNETWTNIFDIPVDVLLLEPELQPEPETRAEFLQYSQEITLDPNTADKHLVLSERNRRVTCVYEVQSYPDHPERFQSNHQVLNRESLRGRCYWEVEKRGTRKVAVAVAYNSISREGRLQFFGRDDKAWMLEYFGKKFHFYHNKTVTPVSGPGSSRVGIYLDQRAGTLSFYSVSDTMTLLHKVQTTFTQPLHAGLGLCYECSAEFCKLR